MGRVQLFGLDFKTMAIVQHTEALTDSPPHTGGTTTRLRTLGSESQCIAIVCGENDPLTPSSQPMPNSVPKLCSYLLCAPIKISTVAGETKHSEEGKIRLRRQSDVSGSWVTLGLCAPGLSSR